MNPPNPEFVLGEMTYLNHRFQVHCAASTRSHELAGERANFSGNESAAFLCRLVGEIREPIIKISPKTQPISGIPPVYFFVTSIGRGAVQEGNERHFLAGGAELPSHLVSDIPAKTITA